MISNDYRQFLILADESANWKVAGLRQLERVLLAIEEMAESEGLRKIEVTVFWQPEILPEARWVPSNPGLSRVQILESSPPQEGSILTTRLFLDRNGLAKFWQAIRRLKIDNAQPGSWQELFDRFAGVCRAAPGNVHESWRYLEDRNDIAACERYLLRRATKAQDGIVSRFLNRPVSRSVTRFVLQYPITPGVWTIAIFVLPILGFVFLVLGNYPGFVLGAAMFQLHSILDGCDGEIARTKYLESERGARLDDFLDMLGSLLYVVGLGIGLARANHFNSQTYILEGALCALLIAANETILRSSTTENGVESAFTNRLYPRHRGMVARSGLMLFGEKPARWVLQLTKRDVAILFFLLLAILNLAQWILHLWLAVSAVTLILSAIAWFRTHGKA